MYRPGCEVIMGEFINVGVPGCFVNCGSLSVEWGNVVVCGILLVALLVLVFDIYVKLPQ